VVVRRRQPIDHKKRQLEPDVAPLRSKKTQTYNAQTGCLSGGGEGPRKAADETSDIEVRWRPNGKRGYKKNGTK